MEYKVIFNDLNKIKSVLTELLKLNSNIDIKTLFSKLENNSFRRIIEIQYIYMLCKSLNILNANKSIKIITLEDNLKLILNKDINVIVGLLNKLGYIDCLLLLLNLKKSTVDNIKKYISKTKQITLKENTLDLNTLEFKNESSVDISDELVNKVVAKIGSVVQITQNVSDIPETKINKIENVTLPEVDSSDDDSDDSDSTTTEQFSIPAEMKKLGNNILNEYTKEEKDDDDNVKQSKITLSKNDTDLIDLLD
jgi:hypothetical protein